MRRGAVYRAVSSKIESLKVRNSRGWGVRSRRPPSVKIKTPFAIFCYRRAGAKGAGKNFAEVLRRGVGGAETARVGRFCFEKILKRQPCQARALESRKFGARQRPWQFAFRVGFFAAASDREQCPAGLYERGDVFDRLGAQAGRQGLQRVGLKHEIELTAPARRRVK